MKKLRRFHSPEKLREIYGHPWKPGEWPEHESRIKQTIDIGHALVEREGLKSGADLSSGDGSIIAGLGLDRTVANDITVGRPIEETVDKLLEPVDLFVCTETIEHLKAPWTVLEAIATKAKFILLSTPLDEDPAIDNYEHYWSFAHEDILMMLAQAGFNTLRWTYLADHDWTYTYQVWTGAV